MREELRLCIVKIGEETITTRAIHGEKHTKVIKEAETHKGYFHTWAHESYVTNGFMAGTTSGQVSTFYGIVEYENGTVHKVDPECITFIDRNNDIMDYVKELHPDWKYDCNPSIKLL